MRSKEAHKICICLSCIEEPYLHSLIEKKGEKTSLSLLRR
ncbi:Uncharacterised protein [Raoultella terrigena]|uniref:Uncharacterized protein n=1 Tax=Raoultella terrigena TaxID=577 RepID=A0A3P8JYB3_RAOTE|nr:Uncharacterised protein [Raoultella terrigena]